MGKNSIINSEELKLFTGLLKVALEREHAILPQVISVSQLVSPGDWVSAAALARGLDAASEEFHTSLCKIAAQHRLLPRGERLFPSCTVCGGSWCSPPLDISQKIAASWKVFISGGKEGKER